MPDALYRVKFSSGILLLDLFSSHIHKVLLNWAEHGDMGDLEVNEYGVACGIEKFKNADILEAWRKYVIPR